LNHYINNHLLRDEANSYSYVFEKFQKKGIKTKN
jgi:hypothetical protein